MKKIIRQFYTDYLLEQAENSSFIRENLTISEYEKFVDWITNLDYDQLTEIIMEQDTEKKKLVSQLSQGKEIPEKGKDVPGLSGKWAGVKFMTALAIAKAKVACEGTCGGIPESAKWNKCFNQCLIDRLQHIIGSLKTEKEKCNMKFARERCYDKFDQAIEYVANRVQRLISQGRR